MSARTLLLRVNAAFLLAASIGGMASDLRGAFAGEGPVAVVLGPAPHAAIGFVEAHGLAMIFGVLLAIAQPARLWHFTAAAIHLLLGAANLVFWPIFPAADMLIVGYVTTVAHGLLFLLHFIAAITLHEGDAPARN